MKNWIKIIHQEEIPLMGSRVLKVNNEEIAIFKNRKSEIFAINNICPHKMGKLSEGLVHESYVTCPLHNWDINLVSGEVINEDKCSIVYETKLENNILYIKL